MTTLAARRLGASGPLVSALGLGCMGMSAFYGTADRATSIATLHRAIDLGISLFDTSDIYGPHTNEQLLGEAIRGRRDQVVLATKFGFVPGVAGAPFTLSGRPEYVREACDASLRRLGVDTIDLYYQHRVDPARRSKTPSVRWPTSCTPARCATWDCPRPRRRRCVAPSRCIRSPRCRPSTRCGAAIPKASCSPPAASWASALSPTARSAAGSSPAASGPSTTWRPTTGGATTRGSRATTSSATSTSSTRSGSWRGPRAARRPSSRWRGCWRRATTSCRFPGRRGSRASRRTSARST